MLKLIKNRLSPFLLAALFLYTPLIASGNQYPEDDPLLSELNKLALPSEPITKYDLPGIRSTIQTALSQITEYIEYIHQIRFRDKEVKPHLLGESGKVSDQPPLIIGLLYFEDWLRQQKCVHDVSMPLAKASGYYSTKILTSYPGQLPISVTFNMRNKMPREFDLTLYVNTASLKFAYLSEMDR